MPTPPPDPQPDHGQDEEAHRKAFEHAINDPARDHPAHPEKPNAVDEEAVATQPAWADDPKHPGPPGWHREIDPNEPAGFHWVEDEPAVTGRVS